MSRETVLALIAGAAVLLGAVFYWTSDSATESASLNEERVRVSRRERRERQDVTGAARERRDEMRPPADSQDEPAPGEARSTGEERDSPRRRVPAIGGGSSERARAGANRAGGGEADGEGYADSSRSGALRSGAGGAGGGGVSRPRVKDQDEGDRDRPELPEARDDQPGPVDGDSDEEVLEPPAEPIREIAYEQDPDRLFDTGVPMEVQGAGRVSPDAGTVSFWMQPEWAHNPEDSADLVKLGETGLQLVKEGSFIRFEFNDPNGNEQGGDADISQWQDGEWHHVIATWTREGMFLYVDGGQAFANQGGARPAANSDPRLFVGSKFPEGTGVALAAMANMTVLNRTSSVEDVQKMFADGGPKKK